MFAVLCFAVRVCCAVSYCAVGSRCRRFSLLGTLWWQVRCASKVECGCRECRCFVLWVPFCAVLAPLRQACCAPLHHAAQWAVVPCGFAVGTLWWQLRCASKVECECRGCRTVCFADLCCAVLCCRRRRLQIRCIVLADSVLCIGRCTVVRRVVMKMLF